jgi:hypothetical protein
MSPGGLNAEEQIQRTSDHRDLESGGSETDNKRRLPRTWKSKYGGMQASDIKRLRELEDENRRLKQHPQTATVF